MKQLLGAGGFNVHCTQRAEAAHKVCMHKAVQRVRKLHNNKTQRSMMLYLLNDYLFQELKTQFPGFEKSVVKKTLRAGIKVPLLTNSGSVMVMHMGRLRFHNARFQTTFLHQEVRIARVELMDLICHWLGLPQIRQSYALLEGLKYEFGQKIVREDGSIFWATDSQYSFSMGDTSHRRRDILRISGTESKTSRPTGLRLK